MNGAEIMVKCLEKEGVKLVFGYPGATICPFYDVLYHADIRHVLVRTEQNAAHAASGYSRVGNGVGVCIATSGPGATNLITGIATAYMDSIPLVAITGQVSLKDLGKDVFQEADVTGACESFVKHSYLVKNVAELPRVFKEAFYIAATGRPGPVLIDVPVDVQTARAPAFVYPEKAEIMGYKPKTAGHSQQIRKALEAIRQAQRPLLCCGGGVILAGAREEFLEFAQKSKIPVISTMMGIGVMPKDHPGYLGMMGSYGTDAANAALREADLIVLCGARVADRAVGHPEKITARIVHMDIDPAEIGKNIGVDIPIVGDAKNILSAFLQDVPQGHNWVNASRLPPASETERGGKFVNPESFLREISILLEEDAILLCDPGQSQIWAANQFSGKYFLTSGGLGTMGYSLPAAIGAKLCCPARQVIAVCGDGAFQMSMCELASLVGENIPVKILVMDNGRLGMVRELQDQCYGGRHMGTHLGGNPDFVRLAEAYGIPARRVTGNDEALVAAKDMLRHKGPYLLVCKVDPDTTCVRRSAYREET
ncbi:MAG: biosynthetic-type acetolactate synthase large subunit [Oscillospiraceae bacterium]